MDSAFSRTALLLSACFVIGFVSGAKADDALLRAGPWAKSADGTVAASFEIRGSETRRNPLRQELAEPFTGATLYVRFRLRYAAPTLDAPPDDEGEFFVLWLDAVEGGDSATHSGGVPNVGIHVKDGRANHFMARFTAGAANEQYAAAVEGDRDYLLVGRLSKSHPEGNFDLLDLWVDPGEGDSDVAALPDASVDSLTGISTVRWIGFSTGMKTEPEDRITVSDVALATSWAAILGDKAASVGEPPVPKPSTLDTADIPDPPKYVAPAAPNVIAEIPPAPTVETDHWAFQPFSRPPVPVDAAAGEDGEPRARTPIDAFIASAQKARSIEAAPPADPATLRRRMALTITGLPPRDEPGHRLEDFDADAYAEGLLDSPQFGERWGRFWLDVGRWAESNGHQHNRDRAHAWRYRDWVIDAFNRDLPYDLFLRQQIAGDEIEPYAPEQIVATGFLAAARYSGNELDKDIQRNDILVDVVNATSKAFLGLTMECAQCHDHFFDPLTQWDYFNLMAFFAKGQPGDVVLESDSEIAELVRQRWGLFESVRSRMVENKRASGHPEPVLVIPKSVLGAMTPAEKRAFNGIEAAIRNYPQAWAFFSPVMSPHDLSVAPNAMRWPLPFQREALEQREVRFLERGDTGSPGPVAVAAWPQVFGAVPEAEKKAIAERPRLALADWLADADHPLTARVWVNRIWQGYFGRGLVETSGDFGIAGSEPDHPELLDWLACELIDSGWSSKHIHRLILKSSVFRQASQFSATNAARDPGNETMWRWQPRRLEAEAIRDSVLAVAGELDLAAGGPSVPRGEQESSRRRAVYLQQRRDNLPHQQMLFDSANAVSSCARRATSTVSLQPLWMLNSGFMQEMAGHLAQRVEGSEAEVQARELIALGLGREASSEEVSGLSKLIADPDSGLVDAAAVIFNTNEFIYIP